MKGKRVLVTGASGLIGHHVLNSAIEREMKVYGQYKTKAVNNEDSVNIKTNLTNYRECLDVCNDKDIVIHCAAKTGGVNLMKDNMLEITTTNVAIDTCMMQAAYNSGVKLFIYISSTTVNYPEEYLGVADVKHFGERMCKLYSEKGMNCLVIRPTQVFGEFDKFGEDSHTIPAFIKRAMNKENPFVIWGDGTQTRDFVYAGDLADRIIGLIPFGLKKKYHITTIGSGISRKIKDVALDICAGFEYLPAFKFDKTKPIFLKNNEPKVDILASHTDFLEALKNTINWYSENK